MRGEEEGDSDVFLSCNHCLWPQTRKKKKKERKIKEKREVSSQHGRHALTWTGDAADLQSLTPFTEGT